MLGSDFSAFDKRALSALATRSGVAAAILAVWARVPETSVQTARSLVDVAHLGLTEELAVQNVLMEATGIGLLEQTPSGFRAQAGMHACFGRLSAALFAIDFYQSSIHRDASTARVVLTKPPMPSELERRLSELGWKTSDLEATDDAFRRMVSSAVRRVVVMTPFLDVRGSGWLQRILSSAQEGVRKVLVLRSLEDGNRSDYPEGFTAIAPWLKAQHIEVFNYSIPRVAGGGRETFHAKVVLCDRGNAYVGSSNLNAASLSHSMEMGVSVSGRAAEHVAIVIDAVLSAATRVI